MRRLLFASLVMLVPLVAAGQGVAADAADPGSSPAPVAEAGNPTSILLPLWQARGGQSLALLARSQDAQAADVPLDYHGIGPVARQGGTLQYDLGAQWQAHASVSQKSWLGGANAGSSCLAADPAIRGASCLDGSLTPRLFGSEIGATFIGSGYSLGMDISSSHPASTSPTVLPRVLPNASVLTSGGLPFDTLQSSTSLRASGRVALGSESGVDLGASVGRIRLLPGNVLGINTLGQKSLSLGVDSGPLSGRIVGRVIQPETGPASALGPEHRWTSIDLGVTWRLPWQGSLSFGAQNVWSSGEAPTPKVGPEPDQSRIPYVQYHQDL